MASSVIVWCLCLPGEVLRIGEDGLLEGPGLVNVVSKLDTKPLVDDTFPDT